MSIVLEDSNLNVAEQVNVLFKSSLGFPSTNETKPWYTETNVKYNNYTFGDEILLDEIPENPTYKSNIQNFNTVKVNPNQIATGGYIKEDTTGVIRYYNRLILTPVPGSSNNSYYALDTDHNNILTNGLQFNTKWAGGQSAKIYPYQLYNEYNINANSSAPDELQSGPTGGNWTYDFKNGIIFFADYNPSLCNGTDNKPVFSFYKYIGRKGVAKQIAIKESVNEVSSPENNQIVVQKSDNTIHRYNGSTWIPIGGSGGGSSGGGSSGGTQTYTNQILEQSGNEIPVPNDKHTLPFNQFTDVSGSETSFTFNNATKLIYKFSFNLTWNSQRGDTISEYQLMVSEQGGSFNTKKTFRLRNSFFSENFETIEYIINKENYSSETTITVKLQGKSINPDYLQKVNYSYFNSNSLTGEGVVKPILEITKIGSRTIEAEALFNKDSSDNIYYTNGNVGIGTNNPTNQLEVSGNTLLLNDLTVEGNVGIGTNNPTNQLEVSGNTLLLNDLTVNGSTVLKDISGTDASFNNVDICGNKLSAKDIHISGNIYQNGTLFSTLSDGDDLNINNLNFSGNINDKFNNIVVRTHGDTVTQISKLTGTQDNLSYFGQSVAIYNNYAIILAPGYGKNGTNVDGYAYIYEFTNCSWTLKNTLFPNGSTDYSTYGLYDFYNRYENFQLVAINDNYAVVGAPGYDIRKGAIYIYERNSDGNWGNAIVGSTNRTYTQIVKYQYSTMDGSFFGYSVAINDTYLAVGIKLHSWSPTTNITGSTIIFEKNNNNEWKQAGYRLISSAPRTDSQYFGWSVAILKETTTGNGDYAVVGAPYYDIDGKANNGRVFIFKRTVDSTTSEVQWGIKHDDSYGYSYNTPNQILKCSDSNTNDLFGTSVAMDENYIVVGKQGAAYIYNFDSTSKIWGVNESTSNNVSTNTETTKLVPPSSEKYFGSNVSINNGKIIVGAFNRVRKSGKCYLYILKNNNWGIEVQGQTYRRPNFQFTVSDSNTLLGRSTAISNNKLLVCALVSGQTKGSVYFFNFVSENTNIENNKIWAKNGLSIGSDGVLNIKSYNYGTAAADYPESVILQTSIDGRNLVDGRIFCETLQDEHHSTGYDYRHILAMQPHCGRVGIGVIAAKSRLHVNNNFGNYSTQEAQAIQEAQERGIRLSYLDNWNHYINIAHDDANILEICANGDIGVNERGGAHGDGYGSIRLKVADKTSLKISTNPTYGDAVEIFNNLKLSKNITNSRDENILHQNEINTLSNEKPSPWVFSGKTDDKLGSAVVINGNFAVIGKPKTNSNYIGEVYIYKKDNTGHWNQYQILRASITTVDTSRLSGYGDFMHFGNFGGSIGFDGNYIIVGGKAFQLETGHYGAAFIFEKDNDGYWGTLVSGQTYYNENQILFGTNDAGPGYIKDFGQSVSIHGTTAIVGSNDGHNKGSVFVFERDSNGKWGTEQTGKNYRTQNVQLTASRVGYTHKHNGESVAIYGDTIISGARQCFSPQGVVYFYNKDSNGNWGIEITNANYRNFNQYFINPKGTSSPNQFGFAVDIYDNYAIASAPNGSRGNVYIFEKSDSGNWSQIVEVNDVDGNTYEGFGQSLSINNNFAIIGKPQHDTFYSGQRGCAYMITKNNEQWGLPSTGSHRLVNSKIVPADRSYENFGASVSSFNNEVIIGAPNFTNSTTAGGRFYSYSLVYSYTFRTVSTNLISNSKNKLQLPLYVGIGTASSDPSDSSKYGLIIHGNIKANSSFIATSDDRVKHNEINITNALQTINALQPKKYIKTQELYSKNHNFILDSSNNPIDESGNLIDYFIEAGIIAQEIKEVDELAIFVKGEEVDKNGTPTALGVDYNSIFCYSLQAIKELDEKNTELKTEVATLKTQMSDVLTRLSQLESN